MLEVKATSKHTLLIRDEEIPVNNKKYTKHHRHDRGVFFDCLCISTCAIANIQC